MELGPQQVTIAFDNLVVLLEVGLCHQVGVSLVELASIHFRNGPSFFS
jgi:hypothetical protein